MKHKKTKAKKPEMKLSRTEEKKLQDFLKSEDKTLRAREREEKK